MPPREQPKNRVPFRIHPRAFKALGADLVTNDIVAIIELVKNSYDACASVVDIRFGENEDGSSYIDIQDDGSGMDRKTIEEAWCTVATPFRKNNPKATLPGRDSRRVSGEKGLGRLSSARLGSSLEMLTKAERGPCWLVAVDWASLADANDLSQCYVSVSECKGKVPFRKSGTRIRIGGLRTKWDDSAIADLRDNLARLLPPFKAADDLKIQLTAPGHEQEAVEILVPKFLQHPKYLIRGDVDARGTAKYSYEHHPINDGRKRQAFGTLNWGQVQESSDEQFLKSLSKPACGPFAFEIRAWDIGPQDTHEISDHFGIKRTAVRRDIRAYKGISVYRDGILVLPKSEGARDWLGLDLRRVGRVGPRLSTPQIVGYVAISADKNPRIEDTSDRERLAATPEVMAFEAILRTIVEVLENEREKDRRPAGKEKRVVELFEQLNAKNLIVDVTEVAQEGGSAADALPLVRDFSDKLDKARDEIETRFIYYSRLATVGTIAQMLIHEVRNRTTVIGNALQMVKKVLVNAAEATARGRVELAEGAVEALEKLAETFAPLANRSFRRKTRNAVVEESVARCLLMLSGDLKSKKVRLKSYPQGLTEVAVDPGELDGILLNLLSNSVYWLGQVDEGSREIEVRLSGISGKGRMQIEIHDSGPGVPDEDAERIFWPGVTNKPRGIGMGLTVAAELVSEHGGRLALAKPGRLGGASFIFDLPSKA